MKSTISANISLVFLICLARFSSALQLVQGPTSQVVTIGQTVMLECSVSSIQEGELVIWKHVELGDTILTLNHLRHMTDPDLRRRYSVISYNKNRDFHLQITDVKATDGGVYECGYTDSRKLFQKLAQATLTVDIPMEGAPDCNMLPTTPQLGDTISLTCTASAEIPTPTLIWEIDGRQMLRQVSASVLTYDRLLQRSDVGATFRCKAISSVYPKGPFCTLKPLPKPMKVSVRSDAPFYGVGDNATFVCTEQTGANVEYNWSKVGVNILMSRRYELKDDNRVLTIINLEKSDNNSILECQVKTATNGITETSVLIKIRTKTTSTVEPTMAAPFVKKNTLHPAVIVVFVLLVVAIVVILALVLIRYSRRKSQRSSHSQLEKKKYPN